jgi:hypothetical protein
MVRGLFRRRDPADLRDRTGQKTATASPKTFSSCLLSLIPVLLSLSSAATLWVGSSFRAVRSAHLALY